MLRDRLRAVERFVASSGTSEAPIDPSPATSSTGEEFLFEARRWARLFDALQAARGEAHVFDIASEERPYPETPEMSDRDLLVAYSMDDSQEVDLRAYFLLPEARHHLERSRRASADVAQRLLGPQEADGESREVGLGVDAARARAGKAA